MMRFESSNDPRRALAGLALLCGVPLLAGAAPVDLADLSIEELGNVKITSLSRRPERLQDAPASVFVITREDIQRAGIDSIPEALRLAPGVEVGRTGSHGWTISMRGFNNDLSNKLLVLIDGRSVYSPLYSGVFWDVQDTLLDDLDRIEIISGPGGTMWGANAVNGVINIITRPAADTAGQYAAVSGGANSQHQAAVRYGAQLADQTAARGYFKYLEQDADTTVAGSSAGNAWRMARAGFRVDRERADDRITVLGEVYHGKQNGMFRGTFSIGTLPGPAFADHSAVAGRSLLVRLTRQQDDGGELQWQLYYDHTERDIPNTFSESRDTYDADFQHHTRWGKRHDIVWGGGYRLSRDSLINSLFAAFVPPDRSDETFSVFAEDKIDLWNDKLFLTLGAKFEHNDYVGFASQPNVRLNWLASRQQSAWLAVSRALRIPSRLDTDIRLTSPTKVPSVPFPLYVQVNGSAAVEAERLTAFEAGYRLQASDTVSLDVAAFHNRYDKLGTTEPLTPIVNTKVALPYIVLPNVRANGMQGEANGGTVAIKWQPVPQWRMELHYANVLMHLHLDAASQDKSATKISGNSPRHQLSLLSFADLPHDLSVYLGARYVAQLPNLKVAQYVAVDTSVRWKASAKLDLSLSLRNLNRRNHVEYINGAALAQPRSVLAQATYRF